MQAFLIQDNNKTEALVDENKTTCPEMYSLSQNNKLCYFLAKIRIVGYDAYDAYETLLVNKTMAVEFCNFFSNGTLPYGKFLLLKYFSIFSIPLSDKKQLRILQSETLPAIRAWFGASLRSGF